MSHTMTPNNDTLGLNSETILLAKHLTDAKPGLSQPSYNTKNAHTTVTNN